ncbi:MAG: LysM peptidoglycan-binding domain-containing protein [Planctomycetes bacterium]|nr:LysM peptidoglycan-binding domain-containing protein [Planctomycetota bacterium]
MQRIATTLVMVCAAVFASGCKDKVEHLDTTPVQDSSYSYQEPTSSSSNHYSSAPVSGGSASYDTGGQTTNYSAPAAYSGSGGSSQAQVASQPYAPAPQSGNSYSAPAGGSGGTHVVQRGETLYALARMYYSDQSKWRVIYEANRTSMSSPHSLRVGQELVIP